MTDSAGGPHPDAAGLAGDALLRRVRTGNAFEDTVSRLLQTIRLGVVSPGDALPSERDLALRFGVSRDTVRDAIKALADAGFLVSRRGRYGGTFVSDRVPLVGLSSVLDDTARQPEQVSQADLDDVLGLRDLLEVGAARAAADRSLTKAQRELLWTSMRETADAEADDYRRLDSRLHLAIGELVGVPSLMALLADNRMRVNEFLDHIPLLERNIAHSNEQHEQIVLAILTGDSEKAAIAMREHLEGSEALLRGFLA
ncbi:FadR family transcriptional regulator [Agreia pratensis]|uniref:Transcriptional regulator, GntR family n=1 Tax=Agreia pratensis TaxID=150121 RepID=A0A1X7IBL5_9MICO|nr:GntR family transcriptional regulator [Agreia pratensis]MBF4633391.1 FadR family transcriptional regulator [Agreia pratensis]SMG11489.1 transcriptional regulator, GntR family [Agreia pratensis]